MVVYCTYSHFLSRVSLCLVINGKERTMSLEDTISQLALDKQYMIPHCFG